MKNVHDATRPAWSKMSKSETVVIFLGSTLFAVYGLVAWFVTEFIHQRTHIEITLLHDLWSVVDVIILTLSCLLIIHYFKWRSLGRYPTTFTYCFIMPGDSNPDGKSLVVGYCHAQPLLEAGTIQVTGASYFWDNGTLNIESRCGFTSTQVWGSRDPATDETTCFIRFKINPEDWEKRTYHHGILQFRLDKTSGTFDEESLKDSYAGYLKSTHTEAELENIEIHSKGYAEWHSKGRLYEDAIERSLKKHGEELFAKLRRMMITRPIPRLWEGAKEKQLTQKNVWGLDIPLPQTTILDQTLRPYINQLLISVLGLVGMDEAATSRFTKSAISQAQLSADDTRVAFERELKMKLTGIARGSKLNAALYARARTIKSQIEPYLVGDSLLDIGCGNGMIASLIQSKFKQVLALDVVEYLPIELGIAFKPYREGDGLPIGDSKYDTVLLLTVLHHASAPLELLKLAWAATNKRLIIIESVVGINKLQANVKYELVNLPYDKQVAYAAFVDWFYNRVLHNDVPVPYNFTTPDQWLSTFRNHDMKVIKTEHFGQDIEIGPEYHVMFVLEKE